ncbi:MAG TPA: NADH-quinone oxidoreductase subunit M, partial [Verrucomicrobiae bacterium]
MNGLPILTILTLLPLVGGIIVAGLQNKRLARNLALAIGFASLALALVLWKSFNAASGEMQFVEGPHSWIPSLGVNYFVGVDGLGLLMVLLTAIVVPLAMLASWRVEDRTSLYFALMLFLQAGLFGTF